MVVGQFVESPGTGSNPGDDQGGGRSNRTIYIPLARPHLRRQATCKGVEFVLPRCTLISRHLNRITFSKSLISPRWPPVTKRAFSRLYRRVSGGTECCTIHGMGSPQK